MSKRIIGFAIPFTFTIKGAYWINEEFDSGLEIDV